ncbi:MAG: DUF3095 domain-containing protein [Hyphomicrobiaceae bacterium]
MTDGFYRDLPAFTAFEDLARPELFRPVPDDWTVLLSDVVGSTAAIAGGRYKDVNMVGAATITAVLNACRGAELPFVFGGDGGVVLVPPSLRQAGERSLLALAAGAEDRFGLSLRVGSAPVSRLRAAGHELGVGKYRLSPGNHLALFSGSALKHAEALLKGRDSEGALAIEEPGPPGPPDLEGLSCRWEPLASGRGLMLTLIAEPAETDPSDHARAAAAILAGIGGVLGAAGDTRLSSHAPARRATLRFRFPPRGLRLEARALAGRAAAGARYPRLLISAFLQYLCERLSLRMGAYDARRYGEEIAANTDFRKYDGMLRMVLDVTPQEADRIEALLEEGFRAGRLVYGLHRSQAALMTCLVFSLQSSEHVHFIDGADGGYALAAEAFKKRAGGVA